MKDVYVYNDALNDKALDLLALAEESCGESFGEPEYKRVTLNSWDLNTLVYILEMDISHMESDLLKRPEREPVARVLGRERELLNKIKGLMED